MAQGLTVRDGVTCVGVPGVVAPTLADEFGPAVSVAEDPVEAADGVGVAAVLESVLLEQAPRTAHNAMTTTVWRISTIIRTPASLQRIKKGKSNQSASRRARDVRSLCVEHTRIDKWLWAVRLFPTRPTAADACSGGHVRVNGAPAKPSTTVRIGDRVTAFAGGRDRIVEVAQIIDKRVGATLAAECFVDHSPPPPPPDDTGPLFVRARGTGRPTKRDRRQLDRFRAR